MVVGATELGRNILHREAHDVSPGFVVGGRQLFLEIVHEDIFVIANHYSFSIRERYGLH